MHRIVALWAHPRSRSTALERVFIERGDFQILHEPFAALYYLHDKKATAVAANLDDSETCDFATIRDRILAAANSQQICFKDMCYYCHGYLLADEPFMRRLDHVFLIRDPKPTIASHFAKNPEVTLEEIGYERQAAVFQAVSELSGSTPPVLRAEDLVSAPDKMLHDLCARLGIAHDPDALTWSAGEREEWKEWQSWHDEVAQSQGIQVRESAYRDTVDNHPKLAEYYRYHLPFYEQMARYAMNPASNNSDGR